MRVGVEDGSEEGSSWGIYISPLSFLFSLLVKLASKPFISIQGPSLPQCSYSAQIVSINVGSRRDRSIDVKGSKST
jgi:hypothetical protein